MDKLSMTLTTSDLPILTFTCSSIEEYATFFSALESKAIDLPKVWCMDGAMGAGKTTVVSAYGKYKGFLEQVTSPTFSLVNEYRDAKGNVYYHFDFYRIKNEREAFEIGTEEYLYSGNICWVEWYTLIPSLLPESYLLFTIRVVDSSTRTITVTIYENKNRS